MAGVIDGGRKDSVWVRRAILLAVAGSLVTGILAGLARLGVTIGWGGRYAGDHGPITVLGAFATVIALERAVALGQRWGFVAPLVGAFSVLGSMVGFFGSGWGMAFSAVLLCGVNAAIVRRQAALFTWLMLLGSLILAAGATAWAIGFPVFDVVLAWMSFFVLTIVAERLELSRLSPTPRHAHWVLGVVAGGLAVSALATMAGVGLASRGFGVLLVATGLWQLRYDIARRLVLRDGLPRFAACGVLGGAVWLVVAGGIFASGPRPVAGPVYDAALHAVFVGYVLSMVFAHAPIILPAVARVEVPFTRAMYVPLTLLHVGLAVRVVGDFASSRGLRQGGAVASAVAMVLFAATIIGGRTLGSRGRPVGV